MGTLATYAGTYRPFTPSHLIPEPSESITWDWMDTLSQFSQRFSKIATSVATMGFGTYYSFDYSALGCDYFPPLLKAYVHRAGYWYEPIYEEPVGTSSWGESSRGMFRRNQVFFSNVGLATCRFYMGVYGMDGTTVGSGFGTGRYVFQLIAYM